MFSSFFVGYALFCFVGGYSADRWGPKTVLTVSMLVWSLFCGLTAAVGIVSLLLVRIIFGMGEGPFCANINKLVSNIRATGRRARWALRIPGNRSARLSRDRSSVFSRWRRAGARRSSSLARRACCGFSPGCCSRRTSRRHQSKNPPMRACRTSPCSTTARRPHRYPISLRPAILATAFAFFGYAYILYFFLSWFPSYLTMAHHLSIQKMSVVSVIPWAVGVTGLVAGGLVCDWLVKKTGRAIYSHKIVLVTSLGAGAVCIGVTGAVTELTSAVALMAIAVFFMYASFNTYFAIVLDTVERRRVGAVGGFVHFIANLADIVAPALTGFLVQWSGNFKSAFILTSVIAALSAIFVAVFVRAPKPQLQLQPELA